MKRRLARLFRAVGRDRRGSALLEFAFVAPILFALTLGVVDVGRLGLAVSSLKHASAEAARYAAVRGNEGATTATGEEIVTFAIERAAGLPADELQVSVSWNPDNSPGSRVTVQVIHEFDFIVGGLIALEPLTLTRASSVTIF